MSEFFVSKKRVGCGGVCFAFQRAVMCMTAALKHGLKWGRQCFYCHSTQTSLHSSLFHSLLKGLCADLGLGALLRIEAGGEGLDLTAGNLIPLR